MAGSSSVVSAVVALARERPEIGKVRAARELRERGIQLSPSAVHTIWAQRGLASSYDRLMLRARRSESSLSEAQRALLRRGADQPARQREKRQRTKRESSSARAAHRRGGARLQRERL